MSGIATGFQHINDIVLDCQNALKINKERNDFINHSMDGIEDTLKHMNVMSIFMFESINRVLDCSKAQKGMELVSKNETMGIVEALELPITCMREIQSKIKIEFVPINRTICSHVVTDKQWFQENMLCLLSNAVKYSSEGTVTILITTVNPLSLPANAKGRLRNDLSRRNATNSIDKKLHRSISNIINRTNSSVGLSGSNRSINLTSNRLRFSKLIRSKLTKRVGPLSDDNDMSSVISVRQNHSIKSVNDSYVSSKSNVLLMVEVQDMGIGISQEVMDELFSPFKHAQRHAGGTGLGLYSLAKRIEALHGYYGVRARADGIQGSNFWFAIPYRTDRATAKQCVSQVIESTRKLSMDVISNHVMKCLPVTRGHSSKQTCNLSENEGRIFSENSSDTFTPRNSDQPFESGYTNVNNQPPVNILLVDDSFSILKLSGNMLRKQGHTVTEALNGSEALSILDKVRNDEDAKPFDIVLMDLHMPVMDGK